MLNSGNMGCRRGDRELSHDAAHSQAIFQQPLRVPGPGLGGGCKKMKLGSFKNNYLFVWLCWVLAHGI